MSKPRKKRKASVPLPEDAHTVILDVRKQIAELEAQLNAYISGLRTGLGVAEEWKIDLEGRVFVPAGK